MTSDRSTERVPGWITLTLEDNQVYLPWHPSLRVIVTAPTDLWRVGRCSAAFEMIDYMCGEVCSQLGDMTSDEFFSVYVLPYLITLPTPQRNTVTIQKQVTRAVVRRILDVGLSAYDGVMFRHKNIRFQELPHQE